MVIKTIKNTSKKVKAFNLSSDEIAEKNKRCNEMIKEITKNWKYSDSGIEHKKFN